MDKHLALLEEDTVDIKELLGQILDFKWWIISFTLVCVLVTALYCHIRTPVYEANLLLKTNDSSGQNALTGLLGASGGTVFNFGRGQSSNEKTIILSRSVLAPVVSKLQLDIKTSSSYFPVIGHYLARRYNKTNHTNTPAKPWFGLSKYNWGGSSFTVGQFGVSDDLKGYPFTLIALKGNQYRLSMGEHVLLQHATPGKIYQLKPTPYTELTINIASLNAYPGVEFKLTQQRMLGAISALSSRLTLPPSKSDALMSLSLKGTDPIKAATTLDAIADSAVQFDIKSQVREATKTLAFLKSRLPESKLALDQSEKVLNEYRVKTGAIGLTDAGQTILTNIEKYQGQLSDLQAKKAMALTQYTEKSFQVEQIDAAIKVAKQQLAQVSSKLSSLPSQDQKLIELTRSEKLNSDIYANLLAKIQQFEILKAGTLGKISIIDEAAVPYAPVNTPASRIIALAAIVGILLSTAAIFIWQFFFHGVEDPDLIERKTGLNVFGTVQESKVQLEQVNQLAKQEISHLKFLSEIDPHDITVESLRSVRTNLLINLPSAKNNIIAISGPSPKVGKSFTSANFAQILADASHKVLLIDADIRKGDAQQYFTIPRSPGLCDLITGNATTDQVIHHSRCENLDFIPTGTMPSRHAELLMQGRVGELLEEFSKDYDYVIVDTAPILAVTDAIQLFKHAGTSLVVFSYGSHDMKEIEQTIKLFEKGGIKLDGFIFNRIKLSRSYYGKKYKYNYRYEYK